MFRSVSSKEKMSDQADAPMAAEEDLGGRLMITRMEMENFKSYFGSQCVGPFHKVFFKYHIKFLVHKKYSLFILYACKLI